MSYWVALNRDRFGCKECQFSTHNKTNYTRHLDTAKCFIRRNAYVLPREVRILIMAYASRKLFIENIDFLIRYHAVHRTASGTRSGPSFYILRPWLRPCS